MGEYTKKSTSEKLAEYLALFLVICMLSFFGWLLYKDIEDNDLRKECIIICKYNNYTYLDHSPTQCQCKNQNIIETFKFKK